MTEFDEIERIFGWLVLQEYEVLFCAIKQKCKVPDGTRTYRYNMIFQDPDHFIGYDPKRIELNKAVTIDGYSIWMGYNRHDSVFVCCDIEAPNDRNV